MQRNRPGKPDIPVALEGGGFLPYPLPVLKIARLATAEGEQRRGYGSALLSYAFAMALKMSSEMGCVGISTDAKPGATDYYAARGFVFIDGCGYGSPTRR